MGSGVQCVPVPKIKNGAKRNNHFTFHISHFTFHIPHSTFHIPSNPLLDGPGKKGYDDTLENKVLTVQWMER